MAVRCITSKTLTAISLNQDGTCIVAATPKGIKIFSTESYEVVRDLELGPINIASMLYCTGFLAFTGTGEQANASPRQLTLYNSVTRAVLRTFSFPTSVLNILLNRQYMAVVMELKVMIYTIGETVDLWCTISTPSNPRGVAALSLTPPSPLLPQLPPPSFSGNIKVLLAVPGDQVKGVIHVHDISLKGEGSVLEIDAHESPLGLLTWNDDGSLLASASVKGTMIRIFDSIQGSKLFTLRRGTVPARITSMAFSPPSTTRSPLFCVASDRGSIHIYRLADMSSRHRARAVAKTMLSAMVHKSPTSSGERIAKIKLPCTPGIAAVCTFQLVSRNLVVREEVSEGGGGKPKGEEEKLEELKIQIATSDGILYEYAITEVKGKAAAQTTLQGQWVFA